MQRMITPGPWEISPVLPGYQYALDGELDAIFSEDNPDEVIAFVVRPSDSALIAQAPAMLEILRNIGRDDDGDGMLDAAGMDRIEALIAAIEGTPTAQPSVPAGGIDPVTDFAAHSAAIEAAQGYVGNPAVHNPPSPAQVAHLLALSGISHGPIGTDQDGEG